MIFALAFALFVFYYFCFFLPTLASFSIDFSLQLSSRRRRRRRSRYCRLRRFRVANSTKFIGPRGYPAGPSSCPPTPPWLTHTSTTFVNGQNFCLPQDEFVYFSSMFALLLCCFAFCFLLSFWTLLCQCYNHFSSWKRFPIIAW